MERVLEKMANQLNMYDEASIMDLWGKYAEKVNNFEPTKRWEQDCIIFCMIQSIRWKNQLFNYHVKNNTEDAAKLETPIFVSEQPEIKKNTQENKKALKTAKILRFSKD